jgi:hypothetical protein
VQKRVHALIVLFMERCARCDALTAAAAAAAAAGLLLLLLVQVLRSSRSVSR